jgi:hypothetical protein
MESGSPACPGALDSFRLIMGQSVVDTRHAFAGTQVTGHSMGLIFYFIFSTN